MPVVLWVDLGEDAVARDVEPGLVGEAEERAGRGPVAARFQKLAAGARGQPAARVHALRYDGVGVAVDMLSDLLRVPAGLMWRRGRERFWGALS